MATEKIQLDAILIPVLVELEAVPGNKLIVVNGVCIGVHTAAKRVPKDVNPSLPPGKLREYIQERFFLQDDVTLSASSIEDSLRSDGVKFTRSGVRYVLKTLFEEKIIQRVGKGANIKYRKA